MRPHNSGHWTIEGARTSQFEQHLRAVLDLPLGAPQPAAGQTVMVNVFGGEDPDLYCRYIHVMAGDPGVKVHIYGKAVRPGRKIGHVTVTGSGAAEENRARAARPGAARGQLPGDREGGAGVSGYGGRRAAGRGGDGQRLGLAGDGGGRCRAGRVRRAVRGRRGVRAPDARRHDRYGTAAAGRGLRVIIAGAGGAAHLPGMLAAVTPLPVIGVPVPLRAPGRARFAAVHRADAGRGTGGHRGRRRRAQRRPARGAHPRAWATRRCASRWPPSSRACGDRPGQGSGAAGPAGRPVPADPGRATIE